MENTQVEKVSKSSNRLKKTLSICILGLLLFLILILVYEYFRIVPENVVFSNVTSSSVTVSWNTKSPISATAVYKKGDGGFINLFGIGKQVFYDTRDLVKAELKAVEQTSKNIAKSDDISVSMSEVKTEVKVTDKGKYYTHHVEIKGLDPETEHSFFVGDDLLYRAVKDVDGNTVIKTAKVAESVKTPVPAYSSVKNAQNKEGIKYSDLTPVNDGVVYVNYFDDLTGTASNQFSAVLNEDGNWYVDLSTAVDNEGNLFFEKYDTDAKNLKIIITVNAGPLGIWRQWQNAYTIAPAQEIVINMVNGVTDESIEGTMVKLSQNINGAVKGIMAKEIECECKCSTSCATIGYSETCDDPDGNCSTYSFNCNKYDTCTGNKCGVATKTCYQKTSKKDTQCSPCLCPSCPGLGDYYEDCPNGKKCTIKTVQCTPMCQGKQCDSVKTKTCYVVTGDIEEPQKEVCSGGKVVSASASKDSCIYYSSFNCNAPCYYVDKCDYEGHPHYVQCDSEYCSNTGIPGLDCRKEPPDENAVCPGSNIKVNQYGMFNSECKKCEWKVVDNRYGGYGLGLTTADSENCSPNPKCGSNNKGSFKAGTFLSSNLCLSGTPFPATLHVSESTHSWTCSQGGKKVSCSATVLSETPDQPEVPDACQKGTVKYDITISTPVVCNSNGQYVKIGSSCLYDSSSIMLYQWSSGGDCVPYNCKTPYSFINNQCELEEVKIDMGCDSNNKNLYWFQDGVMYKCNVLTQRWEKYENSFSSNDDFLHCNSLANDTTNNKYCSNRNLYCIVGNEIYVCNGTSFVKDSDNTNIDPVIFADNLKEISHGDICLNRNQGCACNFNGRVLILSETEWCPYEKCDKEGQVCDVDGKTCSLTPGGMGVPVGYACQGSIQLPIEQQLYSSKRKSCVGFSECQCNDGPDKGKTIEEGQYCREVDNCDEEGNVNKICNSNGNTCSSDKKCNGDMNKKYQTYAKQISMYENCTLDENIIYPKDYQNECLCPNGMLDVTVGIGMYCRNTNDCSFYCNKEGTIHGYIDCGTTQVVCNEKGNTCINENKSWTCNGPKITKPQEPEKINFILKNIRNLISGAVNLDSIKFHVLAESKNTSNYFVIDQKEGMFVNIQDGQYVFEYEGEKYYFSINEMSGSAKVVIDKNNNQQYDEGTDILVSDLASTVQIEPIELRYTYVLKQGFNFVSFPFLVSNQEYRTAASLLKKLNEVYKDTIYSIAKYDGSWKVVGQNVELYSANDFQLVPGQGYVIKAKDDVTIDVWGKPIKYDKDSPNAPVTLFKGWNLVGLYGSGVKQYTAKTLLEDINKYEKVDFSADNVSKWDNELQRYEGFQVSDKNGVPTEYGFDYPIYLLNSYFVRVQDGEGNWQPELAQ